ncbi:pyridoxamine 5'-phosphate oxidase family protein [Chitinophagaceae bacterium 26-R-25]|nr:pyridoxamine 5'-phosphate oxidase family protein [Chitinophagaceae bacterium 26-R-25]
MIEKLSIEQIDNVLNRNIVGRIGCCDGKKVYVVPVNYVYDGHYIIAHSPEGMKILMMRKNPDVCFEVDQMEDITHWQSVIVWGKFQELLSERDRYQAMQLFVAKMMHMKAKVDSDHVGKANTGQHSQLAASKAKPVIYRIVPIEKTGRFELGNMPA